MAAHASTVKTVAKFLREVVRRKVFGGGPANELEDIYNYQPIDGLYATSGQPSEKQFELIKNAGVRTVVNLAPTSVLENSLIDEPRVLAALGLAYHHLPVDFQNPREEDFERFCALIEEQQNDHLWVHCAANMRVSAFTYRYRTQVLGHDRDAALRDLHKVWEPVGVWKIFIAE
ncbi:MAG: protein tyrosine phosphatase family protein [Pseudomonadota bacterium]